jgi:hypothetical protein
MCHVSRSFETFEGAWNMMYCFTLSQVIFLRHFLVALNGIHNSTCETANKNDTSNTTDVNSTTEASHEEYEGVFFTEAKANALKWAMGLLVTELVSVLLIGWSLSILYRLACS